MKIRNGFVSNSSSSSFIVHAVDAEKARKMGLTLISVKTLRECNKQLEELEKTKAKIMESVPEFLGGGCYYYEPNSYDMLGIDNLEDRDFITEPYDRNVAYENGIGDYFNTFQSDL